MNNQDQTSHTVSESTTGHLQRGRILEYITVVWDILEALGSIAAALLSGSVALLTYGIDSVIEVTSGSILLWRLQEGKKGEQREQLASKLVGVSLIALAVYILYDAGSSLILHRPPETSFFGIGIAAVSVILMPVLARAKRKVAEGLNSRSMHADSRQTDICAYLSSILLIGLLLNALFGWWWADPAAALVMVPIILNEAKEAFNGDECG